MLLLRVLLTLKRICALTKKGIVVYAPIFVFEGVNAIQGILCLVYHGSIQIIANIYEHKDDKIKI